MFLTKKSLLKTLALCIAYACVGIIGIGLGVLLAVFDGEALLAEAQTKKMNYQSQAVTDAIYKCDRAKAIGDYQAVENYMKQRLLTTFPKPTNLALLYAHFELAEIYVKTGRPGNAKAHYEYCAANGGQTVIRKKSEEQLKAPELSQTDTAEINYEQY